MPLPDESAEGEVKLCTSGTRVARVSFYLNWIKETVENDFCLA